MTPPAAPFGEVDEPQTFHQTGDGEMWVQLSKYDALKAAHAAAAAAATAARNDALEEAARVLDTTFPDDWSEWAAAKIRALAAQGKG